MHLLTVKGMRCNACKKLITLELEEAGLSMFVKDVKIFEEEEKGIFYFDDRLDDDTLSRVRDIINNMDGYSVS